MKDTKKYLLNNLWNRDSSDYYKIGEKENLTKLFKQPIYKKLLRYRELFSNKVIADIGCGDGSKTWVISNHFKTSVTHGYDISSYAINNASNKYKNIQFFVSDIENINMPDSYYDILITNFVMEHTSNPGIVLNEMLRLCKKNGYVIILCPNYGAPNRNSPPAKYSRLLKLIKGLKYDFCVFCTNLNWTCVEPLSTDHDRHIPDYDTTVEPYLLSTIRYFKKRGCRIIAYNSVWELDKKNKLHNSIFKILGNLKIFPFYFWGPQHFLIIKK